MNPLRIAILAPTFLPKCSGAEVFHHNLASRLAANGHHVTVIAPRARVRQLRAHCWNLPYELAAYPDKRWTWLKRHAMANYCPNNLSEPNTTARNRFKGAQKRPSTTTIHYRNPSEISASTVHVEIEFDSLP